MVCSFFIRYSDTFPNSILNNYEEDITNWQTVTLATAGAPAMWNTEDEAANCTDPNWGFFA